MSEEADLIAEDMVKETIADGALELALDSPANRNALSAPLVGGLLDGLRVAANDPGIRHVVITHVGSTFCAGADLSETVGEGGPEAGTSRLVGLLRAILECPKPVVALLDGHVRAGGIGIVAACDIAVAGPATDFAFTESRLGLAPAIISLTVTPRIGSRAASRYYLTGERFDAEEAARIGLVSMAVPDARAGLAPVLEALRACSPQGLAETKALTVGPLLEGFDRWADGLAATSARLFSSEEAREGMTAFMERRPPRWQL